MDFDELFSQRLETYQKDYNLESLNNSNDLFLLYALIRAEIILEQAQRRLYITSQSGSEEDAMELKKISDLVRDMTAQVTTIQKTLQIDRRSRSEQEKQENPIEYIRFLKNAAGEFLNRRLKKLYCPECKVLVGRFSPVYDHAAYRVAFQCPQCTKLVTEAKKEKQVDSDIRDRAWRTAKVEVIQPKNREDVVEVNIDTSFLPGEDQTVVEV